MSEEQAHHTAASLLLELEENTQVILSRIQHACHFPLAVSWEGAAGIVDSVGFP